VRWGGTVRALIGLAIAFFVSFFFAKPIYHVVVLPYVAAADHDLAKLIPTPEEYLLIQVKVAVFGALFVASPIIGLGIYKFVAPGLYKSEKPALLSYRVAAPFLSLIGWMVATSVAVPLALHFFLNVSDYLSLVTTLILALGIVFQIVGLTLLGRAGILGRDMVGGSPRRDEGPAIKFALWVMIAFILVTLVNSWPPYFSTAIE
jgi:sec-independent protein translocase protein TatC